MTRADGVRTPPCSGTAYRHRASSSVARLHQGSARISRFTRGTNEANGGETYRNPGEVVICRVQKNVVKEQAPPTATQMGYTCVERRGGRVSTREDLKTPGGVSRMEVVLWQFRVLRGVCGPDPDGSREHTR